MPKRPVCLIFALTMILAANARAGQDGAFEQAELPIVGGVEETGYPAVCALGALQPGFGYAGPFCSCTLIAPRWILTAAHCITPLPQEGFNPRAHQTVVFIGTDARPLAAGLGPMDGKTYAADWLIPHPKYDPQKTENDIALVHLGEPIEDVEPMAFQQEFVSASEVKGKPILYVGFGVTDGINRTGAGVKRSVHVNVKSFNDKSYMSTGDGVGVCFGDSGGPGIWEKADGTISVIGVNSTVFGMGSQDPCDGNSFQTRVDVFSAWIKNYITASPSCQKYPHLCRCPEACGEDGLCDSSKCETYNCYRTWKCLQSCAKDDMDCTELCYYRGTAEARALLHPMAWCKVSSCSTETGDQADLCLLNKCTDKAVQCIPSTVGAGDCRSVGECMQLCDLTDDQCQLNCYAKGTLDARAQYNELWDCANAECGERPTYGPMDSCVWEACGTLLNQCFASMECSMVGGGCPGGTACGQTPTQRFDCFPSQQLMLGDQCTPDAATLPCDDGLQCVRPWETAQGAPAEESSALSCLKACAQDAQCPNGFRCEQDAYKELGGLGVCVCVDADGDALCKNEDCDDSDPTIPGKEELCGDNKDNNCDGQMDEGCEPTDPGNGDKEPTTNSDGGCNSSQAPPSPTTILLLLVAAALLSRRRPTPTPQ